MKIGLAKIGNRLYEHAPALYVPLYSAYKKISDREERAEFAAWVRAGDCVLDVGANIGVYAQFFARLVGPKGRVYAFEPEPGNLGRLRRLADRFPQVQVVEGAVAERAGTLDLFVSSDLNVDHRTYDAGDGRARVTVPALALDDFVDRGVHVAALKMDIQGAELSALRGALRLLRNTERMLAVIEYWPYGLRAAGENPLELIELLASSGFTVRTVGNAALPDAGGADPDAYANLIATKGMR